MCNNFGDFFEFSVAGRNMLMSFSHATIITADAYVADHDDHCALIMSMHDMPACIREAPIALHI
jgi:hypothetical protein